jgi:23S rRNA (uracil1939-C5)-methyltransferase
MATQRTQATSPTRPRSAAIFVETERGRRRGEEPYSRTATTPDVGIAKVSAKSTALLVVTSLAPGGDGVAHVELDGQRRAVFVPHAAPGDLLRAEIDASHRPARGRVLDLLAPGPDRVTPACRWSTRCGGCDWMHLSLEAQARTHVEHVRAALPAEWRHVAVVAHPAPEALGYRTRARVHVRCASGRASVGMHQPRTHQPVQVDSCAVLGLPLERARRALPALFEGSRGHGEVQIALGVGRLPVLEVRWMGHLAMECFARLEHAIIARDLAGARVTMDGASRPAIVGDPTPWTVGADGAPLRLAPGGFAQASELTSAMLARHVAELVRPWNVETAVELYAGSGNLSVLLAPEVRNLVLVESSREACDAARANLASRGLRGRIVTGEAEGFAWSAATKLAVMDPPRSGALAVAKRLAASRVRHVIYVSCDAQTLGRDLKLLAPAYQPQSVATFEMFPQTSHVETVVALERRTPRAQA